MAFLNGGFLPAKVAGTKFDVLVHVSDWYPTLCALAGISGSDDPPNETPQDWFYPVDGHNVWPYLLGGADPRKGSEPVVLSSLVTDGAGGGAMIIGKYKIVYDGRNSGWNQPPTSPDKMVPSVHGNDTCVDGTSGRKCKICSLAKPCLYDVWADDSEFHNLAKKLPNLVQSMNVTFAKLVFERRFPSELEYTSENGWDCKKGRWGVFDGPKCVCTLPKQACKLTLSVGIAETIV